MGGYVLRLAAELFILPELLTSQTAGLAHMVGSSTTCTCTWCIAYTSLVAYMICIHIFVECCLEIKFLNLNNTWRVVIMDVAAGCSGNIQQITYIHVKLQAITNLSLKESRQHLHCNRLVVSGLPITLQHLGNI